MTMLIPDALPVLAKGAHEPDEGKGCLIEVCSVIAGEPWSDHTPCVHPVLAAAGREVNDRLPDGERDRLWLLVPDLLSSAGAVADWSPLDRQRLDVRLASWAARQVLGQVRAADRGVCETAIIAAEAWADDPTPAARTRAAYAAYAANAAAYAAYANVAAAAYVGATATANAAVAVAVDVALDVGGDGVRANGSDPVAFLAGLIAEYRRLTGSQPTAVTPADVARVREVLAGVA